MEAVSWGAAPSELPVTNGGKMSHLPGVKNPWWAMAQSTPSQIPGISAGGMMGSLSYPRFGSLLLDWVALIATLAICKSCVLEAL